MAKSASETAPCLASIATVLMPGGRSPNVRSYGGIGIGGIILIILVVMLLTGRLRRWAVRIATTRAQFAHLPRECLKLETAWRSGLNSNARWTSQAAANSSQNGTIGRYRQFEFTALRQRVFDFRVLSKIVRTFARYDQGLGFGASGFT